MKRFQFLLLVLLMVSCSPKIYDGGNSIDKLDDKITSKQSIPIQEHLIYAVLWQQKSAEYKSLCHQAYNLAKLRLDQILLENKSTKPLAIVTDIDETVLDNSPYSAKLIEDNVTYNSKSWNAWGKLEMAETVPGAVEFFNYAASKGVEIFYISNRNKIQKEETINNLKKQGLPFSDYNHLLLKTDTSCKKDRRESVLRTHNVVLLIGDNLGDFDEIFDKKSTQRRNSIVDSLKIKFGKSFIMLPNPMYGAWEYGLYNENPYGLTEKQKDSIRKAKLRSY